MKLVVTKFGGTSVENGDAMRRVAEIVKNSPGDTTLVVISACAGVTNQLLHIGTLAGEGRAEEANALVMQIAQQHATIVEDVLPHPERAAVQSVIDISAAELLALVSGISHPGRTHPPFA